MTDFQKLLASIVARKNTYTMDALVKRVPEMTKSHFNTVNAFGGKYERILATQPGHVFVRVR